MKYKIMISMLALFLGCQAYAGPVTTEEARQKAASFLMAKAAKMTNGKKAAAYRAPQLQEAPAFDGALHIFNVGGDNGFVIVSADDRTEEILGYVDSGSFDINRIPSNMRAWLQDYANQIRSLGNTVVTKAPRKAPRAEIPYLCKTQWDQSSPFNQTLTDDYNEQSQSLMTGCVATALSQCIYLAAKNYKAKRGAWPTEPTTEISSYTVNNANASSNGWTLPALAAGKTFDWDNMREDNYSRSSHTDITDAQETAVADLMKYVSRALQMEYDKYSSASVFVYASQRMQALRLSPYMKNIDRGYYNTQEWEELLYNELKNGRAVAYSSTVGASTSSEGHAFVLDGYKDGLWHINWGWGKSAVDNNGNPTADGWFSLSVLQPAISGSGGASVANAEYKYNQQAAIDISFDDPTDAKAALQFYWANKSSVYTSYVYNSAVGLYNILGGNFTFDTGWAIRKADGSLTFLKQDYEGQAFEGFGTTTGKSTTYFSDFTFPSDGTYDIVYVCRETGTEEWVACGGTETNYITVTVSDGKVTKAVAHPVDPSATTLSIANIDYVGDMEANEDNTLKVTINNSGDDFFGTLAMYYSTSTSLSSTQKVEMLADLAPGESTHEFKVNLPKGEYNLWFIANPGTSPYSSDAFGTGKLFIGYGADANLVQAGNLLFDGQTGETLSVKSINGKLAKVTGTFDVDNKADHIYTNTYYINVESPKSYYSEAQVMATVEVPVEVEAGQKQTVPFNLGIVKGLNSSTTYSVRLYTKSGDAEATVATKDLKLTSWFRYWAADGTQGEAQEPSYSNPLPDAAKVAMAIDCRGLSSTTYIKGITNTNCIYYITADQKPSSSYYFLYGKNLIIDGVADKISLDAANGFYVPEAFTATEISYTRTFEKGQNADKKPYWYTMILPFEVNNVVVESTGKNIDWFHNANQTRKHFWVMALTAADGENLTFDYAADWQANVPYIVSVPGDRWGDNWNLAGKALVFKGLDVTVPVTELKGVTYGNVSFNGTYSSKTVTGYVLDSEANKFTLTENATVAGYNAYITTAPEVKKLNIVTPFGDATGIDSIESAADSSDDRIYTLSGVRVSKPQRGVYIKNGKKVVVR